MKQLDIVKQEKSFVLVLFIVSLLLRALFFVAFTSQDRNAWVYFDSDQYLAVAQQIADGNGISTADGQPNFYRLPGYPLFLATGFKFFNNNLHATLLFQIVIASMIPILMFLLAFSLFPTSVLLAKIIGFFSAIHLGFVLYSGMIATESLSLIFFLLFLLFFFSSITRKNMLLAGLCLGFTSLVRPIGHYMLLVSLFVLLVQSKSIKKTIINGGWLSGAWLVTVSPWLIRNLVLAGGLFFHTLPGLHFLQYSVANILVARDGISYVTARKTLLEEWDTLVKNEEKKVGRSLNEYQRCCIGEKRAFQYMRENPWHALKYSAIQWFKTCFGLYSAQIIIADNNQWHNETTSVWDKLKRFLFPEVKNKFLIPIIYWEIILFLFLLLGFMMCLMYMVWNSSMVSMVLKTLPFAVALVFLTLAYGCARLRFPAEPFIIILGVCGWFQLVRKKMLGSKRSGLISPTSLILLSFIFILSFLYLYLFLNAFCLSSLFLISISHRVCPASQ